MKKGRYRNLGIIGNRVSPAWRQIFCVFSCLIFLRSLAPKGKTAQVHQSRGGTRRPRVSHTGENKARQIHRGERMAPTNHGSIAQTGTPTSPLAATNAGSDWADQPATKILNFSAGTDTNYRNDRKATSPCANYDRRGNQRLRLLLPIIQ